MITKLDILRQNAKIKEEREKNIAILSDYLEEAKTLYNSMPAGNDLQIVSERKTVKDRIEKLNELIEDEKRAIDELDKPSDDEINGIIRWPITMIFEGIINDLGTFLQKLIKSGLVNLKNSPLGQGKH